MLKPTGLGFQCLRKDSRSIPALRVVSGPDGPHFIRAYIPKDILWGEMGAHTFALEIDSLGKN